MILGYSPAENVWFRASMCWVASSIVITFDLVILDRFSDWNTFVGAPNFALYSVLLLFSLLLIGKCLGECNRVLAYVAIFGVFGLGPLLFAMLLTSGISVMFFRGAWGAVLFQYGALTLIGLVIFGAIARARAAINGSDLWLANFRHRSGHIFVSRMMRAPSGGGILADKYKRVLGGVTVPAWIGAVAYAAQRFLGDFYGEEYVFVAVSALLLPCTIYCGVRVLGGAYFWVILMIKFEAESGKKIIFLSKMRSIRLYQDH
jgi:hypothetical protein